MPEKRFQFYDILPGKSDALPEKKETPPADATKKTSTQNKEASKESGKEPSKEAPKENAKESKAPFSCRPARSARRRTATTRKPNWPSWALNRRSAGDDRRPNPVSCPYRPVLQAR
jgi:hypothetical protein